MEKRWGQREFSHVVPSIHGSDLRVVSKEGAPRLSSQFAQT